MQKVKDMTVKLFINGVEDHGFCSDRYAILAQPLFNDEFPDRGLRRSIAIGSLFLILQFRLFVVKFKALLSLLEVPFLLLKPETKLTLKSLVKFWTYLVETWNEPSTKR